MSSRKRLTWRTLREASESPFLCASSSSSTTIGRYTSCSSKRKMAVGSCISTLVSSTNRRRPVRERPFTARDSPEAAVGPGSLTLRCFKYRLRMAGNLDVAPLLLQTAGAVYQERAALHPEILSAVQGFLPDHIEQLAHLLLGVGEQRKRKRFLRREAVVRGDAVARDADDGGVGLAERRGEIAEVLRLARAAGGHVARIEVDD